LSWSVLDTYRADNDRGPEHAKQELRRSEDRSHHNPHERKDPRDKTVEDRNFLADAWMKRNRDVEAVQPDAAATLRELGFGRGDRGCRRGRERKHYRHQPQEEDNAGVRRHVTLLQ
jgi:hypothetical protein